MRGASLRSNSVRSGKRLANAVANVYQIPFDAFQPRRQTCEFALGNGDPSVLPSNFIFNLIKES